MDKLTRDHVYKAAVYISNLHSIPKKRGLRTWAVPVKGVNYPPKFLLSVARHLSGDDPEITSGKEFITEQAVSRFRELGFEPKKITK